MLALKVGKTKSEAVNAGEASEKAASQLCLGSMVGTVSCSEMVAKKVGDVGAIGPVHKKMPILGLNFGVGLDTQSSVGIDTCSSRKDYDNNLGVVASRVGSLAGGGPAAGAAAAAAINKGVSEVPVEAAPRDDLIRSVVAQVSGDNELF